VLAVFVTWVLARAEYLRNQRQARARLGAEVDLLEKIVADYGRGLKGYTDPLRTSGSVTPSFYSAHMNDPEWHAMRDLAHVPVIQWPSLEAYMCFKGYWSAAVTMVEGAREPAATKAVHLERLAVYDDWHGKLRAALKLART
jgi:hypothetical protein